MSKQTKKTMNTQTRLSAEDAARLMEIRLRQELLQKDSQILQLDMRLFQAHVAARYGNPNETIEIGPDNMLTRKPKAPAQPPK